MSKPSDTPWKRTAPVAPGEPESWEATRAQTSMATLVVGKDDYLGATPNDIGTRVSDEQRELFVSSGPADALRQQFDALKPTFIAVHDIGAAASRRLLAALATAAGRVVQKLVIRRHGAGVALATLEFIDAPATLPGESLRFYTTAVEADTKSRQEIAHLLLRFSRLGVLMIGALPAHALESALRPLESEMLRGPWRSANIVLLPLASAGTLSAAAEQLAARGVSVRTTPKVARPIDAWTYIAGAWNRVLAELGAEGATLPHLPGIDLKSAAAGPQAAHIERPAAPETAAAPAPAGNAPPLPAQPAAAADPIARYVQKVAELAGVVSVCVFDSASQRPLAHAGTRPGPAMLAMYGATLAGTIAESGRALGLGEAVPDAAITLGHHHMILHALPGDPPKMLHAVVDRGAATLTAVRLQVLRLDSILEDAGV